MFLIRIARRKHTQLWFAIINVFDNNLTFQFISQKASCSSIKTVHLIYVLEEGRALNTRHNAPQVYKNLGETEEASILAAEDDL